MSELIKHTPKLWERRMTVGSYWLFWCQGCNSAHSFRVGTDQNAQWTFDGKIDEPTFAPSLRLLSIRQEWLGKELPSDALKAHDPKYWYTTCHLTITAGQITFHGDCPHSMAGKVVPMSDIPSDYGF